MAVLLGGGDFCRMCNFICVVFGFERCALIGHFAAERRPLIGKASLELKREL